MQKINFNESWTCKCLTRDEVAYQITLPHDAMLSEPRTEESQGEGNIGWYIGGDYEYTKNYVFSDELKEKKLVLEFEGVYHNAEVYLNGEKIAFRPYGYTNFYVDLTGKVKFNEENEIRVIAHNTDHPNSRWYSGTGIYRPVNLFVADQKHILMNGVRIRTVDYKERKIEVEVRTSEDGKVSCGIFDGTNCVVSFEGETKDKKYIAEIKVPQGKLWDLDTPNLYTCEVWFEQDCVRENFGIRSLKWNEKNGMTINGKRVILKGACIHHDNGVLGACAFPEAEERKVRVMKKAGYNALRSAHNPCSKAILDACDRLGMLMMDEYVDVWYIHKTKNDYVTYLKDWWKEDLKDMVEKDFNHPSVVMYSTGNEVSETAQEKGIKLTGEFTEYLHSLDDTRPVTCGINIFFNFLSSVGMGVYSDDKAEKLAEAAKASAEKAKQGKEKKKSVGSEFYNKLAVMMGTEFMKRGATLPPCDWKTKGAFANMDIAGYNYGIYRYKHDMKKYPKRLILGSETFCSDAYAFYEIAKKYPRVVGDFVWSGMDYIGETGLGAGEYESHKFDSQATCMTGGNGRVDLLGKERVEAAYTKIAFEIEQGPFIAVYPACEKGKPQFTGWQLSKAIESWSYQGCSGNPVIVEVYARAASVELFVNGKSVGKNTLKNDCRTTFKTTYEDGEVKAVSYDTAGKVIGEKVLKTAEKAATLKLHPESETAKPGELIFIPMQYSDQNGIWTPMERHTLKVSVENGTLVGLGCANPYIEGNFTDDTTRTFYGEAMAVVRAGKSGDVKMIVQDEEAQYDVIIPIKGE